MKGILILVAISFLLCSTASAAQGGGGESTRNPKPTQKGSVSTKKRTVEPHKRSSRPTPGVEATTPSERANRLIDECNAMAQEVKKYVADAEEKKQKMLHTTVAELAEARTTAKDAIVAYDKAEEMCKEVSKKYEEATKLKLKDEFKEYLLLKTKEFDKRAELVKTAKGMPQALIDSESHASFVSLANANNEKVDKLTKEADDLRAQAERLQKRNPDMFKS